jgi:hypothetical protein
MSLFHRIMNKLGRYRLIPDRRSGADYMHRYYLFLKDRTWFPFNVALHKIVRSDDPIFHDHPWPYLTIVLKGGYWEHTPVFNTLGIKLTEFQTWRGPGSIIMRRANEFHWLELDDDKPATTLFFMGPQKREWGFLINKTKAKQQWIQHDLYLRDYQDYHKQYVEPKIAMSKKKQ